MGFDICNHFLKIQESIRTPTPKVGTHLGMWRFIPSHSLALSGAWNVTLGLPSWPTPSQALVLVVSPRLRLWHNTQMSFCSFIGLYILHTNIMHSKHVWYTNKCVDGWSMNLWMNECHINFTSFYISACWMCFQCTMLMHEMYKLWINDFHY